MKIIIGNNFSIINQAYNNIFLKIINILKSIHNIILRPTKAHSTDINILKEHKIDHGRISHELSK